MALKLLASVGRSMLVDIAKPIALMLCLTALCGVFFAAFMAQGGLESRLVESLELLVLTAGISVASGLIFREPIVGTPKAKMPLTATLPVQVFFWAAGIMCLLFLVSWYLETYCIFYRNIYF